MPLPKYQLLKTGRQKVLDCINEAPFWITAREISDKTHMDYKAVIDALTALHDQGRCVRDGRKTTARWGKLALLDLPKTHGPLLLERILNGIFRTVC